MMMGTKAFGRQWPGQPRVSPGSMAQDKPLPIHPGRPQSR